MASMKQAHLAREKTGAEIFEFYIDINAFGKGYQEFYKRVREEGVLFIRGKGSEIFKRDGRLVVAAEDTLLGTPVEIPVDLVVLGTGLTPRSDAERVTQVFSISRSADGFFMEAHPKLRPVSTHVDGIFVAGCCQGPKDIPDTVAQATAAAAEVMAWSARARSRWKRRRQRSIPKCAPDASSVSRSVPIPPSSSSKPRGSHRLMKPCARAVGPVPRSVRARRPRRNTSPRTRCWQRWKDW